jgi:AcrR family transcriptional regulator
MVSRTSAGARTEKRRASPAQTTGETRPGRKALPQPAVAKPSLRVRKTARTREAIIKVSRKLFDRQGFEATTLEQIAELADVHKQTVLRYFSSKEEIALAYRHDWYSRFIDAFADRDYNESVIKCWRRLVDEVSHDIASRKETLSFYRFIQSTPKLVAHSLSIDAKHEAILGDAFIQEAPGDPADDFDARLLAAFLVQTNRVIMETVVRTGSADDIPRLSLHVVDFAMKHFPRARDRPRPNDRRPSRRHSASPLR